jgi:hypothetical protein
MLPLSRAQLEHKTPSERRFTENFDVATLEMPVQRGNEAAGFSPKPLIRGSAWRTVMVKLLDLDRFGT